MDKILRILLKRAEAENNAEAWRAYAAALERTHPWMSSALPSNKDEEITNFVKGITKFFDYLKTFFEPLGADYVYFTNKNVEGNYVFISGYLIITGEPANDLSGEAFYAFMQEFFINIVAFQFGASLQNVSISHLLISEEARDDQANSLHSFEGGFYLS